MQELNVQPTNPTPYTPAGGTYNNNPVPGAGGLPSLSGLNNRMNPMAQELQAQGRGEDSVLVHMTPDEVNSLRGLAQKFGGDLSTNPTTGLPEAGWLGKLLPTILGVAGAAVGIPTWAIGLGVGAGGTAITGDLNKGLMAGLQAFGGASMASGLGVGPGTEAAAAGAGAGAAPQTTLATSGGVGANAGIGATEAEFLTQMGGTSVPAVGGLTAPVAAAPSITGAEQAFLTKMGGTAVPQAATTPGFFDKFSGAAREGMKAGTLPYKVAPYAAGLGSLSAVSDVTAPDLKKYEEEEDKWKYEGPYYPMPRRISPRATGPEGMGEISFFDVTNPVGYLTASGERRGYAEGGSTETQTLTLGSSVPHYTNQAWERDAVPIAERGSMAEYAGDANAYSLMSKGIVDDQGRRGQFSGTLAQYAKPGRVEQFGDNYLKLGDDQRWYTTTAPPPPPAPPPVTPPPVTPPPVTPPPVTPPPPVSPPPGGTGTNTTTQPPAVLDLGTTINPLMGGVTPGSGTGATVSQPKLSPGATASGYGAEALKEVYTPNFTSVAEYTTQKATPYTMGSQMSAALPGLTSMFQTSPGAITASRGYEGGSPSERIRAMAKANAAATANAATNPLAELDFGLPKTSAINTAAYTASGLPDFTKMTPQDIFNYYNRSGPAGGPARAHGGSVHMDDGAFVVDARTVSELGNGSSNAGIEMLQRLGGRAVRGPGDGVSDSVRANIGGTQEARVARDEVIFPAATVKKLGGAKKLYALMDKAHKARKKAKRGQDTKVAKGLGALA